MLIYVVTPSGRTRVSLRPSDTIGDLKVRIEDDEWIPKGTVRRRRNEWIPKGTVPLARSLLISLISFIACSGMQRLTYRRDKLEDGRIFESYGIGEGATIHLSRPHYAERDEAYYIYVQRTEEEVFRIRIKASDTIGSLKTRLWNGRLTPSGENNNTQKT